MCLDFVVNTVAADDLAPNGARASADTVLIKLGPEINKVLYWDLNG